MIVIITGSVGSGKSTKIKSLFDRYGGAGVWLPAVTQHQTRIGQDLMDLRSGQRTAYTRRTGALPPHWQEAARLDTMSFSLQGQRLLHSALQTARCGDGPLFIDEIGPLELMGHGAAPLIPLIKPQTHRLVFLAIRTSCLDAAIGQFALRPGCVLHLD